MCFRVKSFLYTFDFVGIVPQFRILKYDSYKTIFSSIISIIITIFSIGFSLFSIIDYLKFVEPSISYLMKYDNESNNSILLKDTFLMFKANKVYFNNTKKDLELKGFYSSKSLNIEQCQIGKNINIKFRDSLEKQNLSHKINEYYCISYEDGDLPLFFNHELNDEERNKINIYIYMIIIMKLV